MKCIQVSNSVRMCWWSPGWCADKFCFQSPIFKIKFARWQTKNDCTRSSHSLFCQSEAFSFFFFLCNDEYGKDNVAVDSVWKSRRLLLLLFLFPGFVCVCVCVCVCEKWLYFRAAEEAHVLPSQTMGLYCVYTERWRYSIGIASFGILLAVC